MRQVELVGGATTGGGRVLNVITPATEYAPSVEATAKVKAERLPNVAVASPPAIAASDDAIRLATKLTCALGPDEQIIALTEPDQRGGAKNVAAQLAIALVQIAGGRVALVDAHVASPSLHKQFDLPEAPGLTALRREDFTPAQIVYETGIAGLALVPAGERVEKSKTLFSSLNYFSLVSFLRENYRFVVIAAPPMPSDVHANLIVKQSDAVVIAAAANKHNRADVVNVKQELDGLRAKIAGVILTQ